MTDATQTQMQTQPDAAGQIDIPTTALVHCPLTDFKLRPVHACTACEHFGGLVDRFPGGPHSFVVRYRIACKARPTLREMQELA